MEISDVDALFERLRSISFGSLSALNISLELVDLEEDIGAVVYGPNADTFTVQLDRRNVSAMSEDAVIGCLAHELCHIDKDTEGGSALGDLPNKLSSGLVTEDEREVDRMVIAKGYGPHLLAFQIYHDENYEPYNACDGLTRDEIIAFVKT